MKNMNKILSGALIAGVVASSLGGAVFAKNIDLDNATMKGKNFGQERHIGQLENKGPKGNHENMIAKLVSDGVITQDVADKWNVFMESKQADMKAEMEKVKAMTAEERKAYFEQNKKERPDMLKELVTAGVLTQEKADEISKLMPQKHEKMDGEKGFKGNHEDRIAKLVSDGVITQDVADKWNAFMESKQTDMKAEMEKVKAMTAEERKAYFEQNKKERPDMLKELVTAGVLTQEKADEISKLMPQKNK